MFDLRFRRTLAAPVRRVRLAVLLLAVVGAGALALGGPLVVRSTAPVAQVASAIRDLPAPAELLVPAPARPAYTAESTPGGTFYALVNSPRAIGSGFSVIDDGGVPFYSALAVAGGVEQLGYPVSRRFWQTDAIYQVFEHGVLRWQPKTGETALLPREASGLDEAAAKAAFTPELPLLPAARATARLGRAPLVLLDPGHGGRETGGTAKDENGAIWTEKYASLDVALAAQALLKQMDYQVKLTRETDAEVAGARYGDVTGDKDMDLRDELQARNDIANRLKPDLFVAIHFNISANKLGGIETYYCSERPYAAENQRIAQLLQDNLVDAVRGAGKIVRDKGLLEDSVLSDPGKHEHLYLLGPTYNWLYRPVGFPEGIKESRIRRPSEVPAVLTEAAYLSSPADREQLDQPWLINTMARATVAAITQYLAGEPADAARGELAPTPAPATAQDQDRGRSDR